MQQVDFLLDVRHQVARVLLSFAMVVVPFEVEHVSSELMLRVLYLLQILLVLVILL